METAGVIIGITFLFCLFIQILNYGNYFKLRVQIGLTILNLLRITIIPISYICSLLFNTSVVYYIAIQVEDEELDNLMKTKKDE